jgi:hypothetical protein
MEPKIKPITPTSTTGGDFGKAFFLYLQGAEGRVERIHSDNKGIPTLGTGTALAVRHKAETDGVDIPDKLLQDLTWRAGG